MGRLGGAAYTRLRPQRAAAAQPPAPTMWHCEREGVEKRKARPKLRVEGRWPNLMARRRESCRRRRRRLGPGEREPPQARTGREREKVIRVRERAAGFCSREKSARPSDPHGWPRLASGRWASFEPRRVAAFAAQAQVTAWRAGCDARVRPRAVAQMSRGEHRASNPRRATQSHERVEKATGPRAEPSGPSGSLAAELSCAERAKPARVGCRAALLAGPHE